MGNVYSGFDMKNIDVRTDGKPVTYKPEYHPSGLQSEVFPNVTNQ